jgi:hypothetical protein
MKEERKEKLRRLWDVKKVKNYNASGKRENIRKENKRKTCRVIKP